MDTLDATTRERIDSIVAAHMARPGPLLEVLHEVQRDFGHVPPAAVALIARGLNLSRAEVHGVVTFYHHFRSTPPGRHRLQICRAESCQSMQGDALGCCMPSASSESASAKPPPTARCTLEAVYCLGNCACSPAILIDDEPHGRVTPQRLDELLAACGAADARRASSVSAQVYVPRDSGALSLGAEAVARGIDGEAARRGIEIRDRAQRLTRPLLARAAGRGARSATTVSPTVR